MDAINVLYFAIGFLIVLVFSLNYYNHPGYPFADEDGYDEGSGDDVLLEPALPKYMTGRFEYNVSLLTYVLATEFIYVLLVFFLPDLQQSGASRASDPPLTLHKDNIVLATLIITGIAPNLPFVRTVLDKAKVYLHSKAQIPRRGREVFRRLDSHAPAYMPEAVTAILSDERYVLPDDEGRLRRPDLHRTDFDAPQETIEARWAKLSYLLHHVDHWSEKPPLKSYVDNQELRRSAIDSAYRKLRRRVIRHRQNELSPMGKVRLHQQLDTTLKRTYRLISCLLYLAGKKETVVNRYLDALGYAPAACDEFPIPLNRIVLVIAVVVGSIFAGVSIAWFVATHVLDVELNVSTDEIMDWVLYAVPFLTMPIIMVLLLKRYCSGNSDIWPVVCAGWEPQRLQDRPWHIYFLAAMLAYLTAAIMLAVPMSIEAKLQGLPLEVPGRAPIESYAEIVTIAANWSWLVFVIAGFSAFSIDSVSRGEHSQMRRTFERIGAATFQGAVVSGLTFFIFMHEHVSSLSVSELTAAQQTKLAIYCLNSFILGFALNIVANFGQVRQKRRERRRKVSRDVMIGTAEHAAVAGTIEDVSPHGALVMVGEAFVGSKDEVKLVGSGGTEARGHVVGTEKGGTRLHVEFDDETLWDTLQRDLKIAAP